MIEKREQGDEMSVKTENYGGFVGTPPTLFGRRTIYTSAEVIDKNNVIDEVNSALGYHLENLVEEEYLYWYRRGMQPILNRTKKVRPEIMNTVVENHADEIVSFKNGYFLTQPAAYVSRNEKANKKVKQLNEYLYRSGKQQADNRVVDWFHTVGKGALIVQPNDDIKTPVVVHALDPRSAFVVYSLKPGNAPKLAINMVVVGNEIMVDAITTEKVFRLKGKKIFPANPKKNEFSKVTSLMAEEPNTLRKIPIIEYQYNSVCMGAFESVIPLLDSINTTMSNRIDGIEQFIQSLAIAVNCNFEEGTTANDIREAGMIVLKSVGENKADFKILSEQLNQTETQVAVDYMYQQVLSICGMPSTTKGGSSTSDTGVAVLARDGWYQADTVARNTKDLFMESNKLFDEIFLEILKRKGLIKNLDLADFELCIVRNETANIQSKAQAFNTLLASGMHPILAATKSGVSSDPANDISMSEKYLKMIWGNPDAKAEPAPMPVTETPTENAE